MEGGNISQCGWQDGRWRYLGNRCSDKSIVEACDQKLIENTSRSSIIYQSISTCAFSNTGDNRLMETAIEPPNATQALSMVRAKPQILRRP